MADMDSYKPFAINRLPLILVQTVENKRSLEKKIWQIRHGPLLKRLT